MQWMFSSKTQNTLISTRIDLFGFFKRGKGVKNTQLELAKSLKFSKAYKKSIRKTSWL